MVFGRKEGNEERRPLKLKVEGKKIKKKLLIFINYYINSSIQFKNFKQSIQKKFGISGKLLISQLFQSSIEVSFLSFLPVYPRLFHSSSALRSSEFYKSSYVKSFEHMIGVLYFSLSYSEYRVRGLNHGFHAIKVR